MAHVGISELARQLGVGKGTLSKQAAAGKIPVADRDAKGNPLFDVEAVRTARDKNLNPLMRRDPLAAAPEGPADPSASADDEDDATERRSVPEPGRGPRPASALVEQQKLEKQLKNRRLLRQVAIDEGLLILKSVSDEEKVTLARRTRDGVIAQISDQASALYAFTRQPRTEAELRVWLGERAGIAFNEVAKAIDAEEGDEFDDAESADEPRESIASAAA